jgi:hypothetical protein
LRTEFFATTLSSTSTRAFVALNDQRGLGWPQEVNVPPSTR